MPPVVDSLRGGAVCRLADEDAVRRRGRLKACCRIHDISCRHTLAYAGSCAESDERLARVDRNAHLQLPLLRDPVANRERGPDSALRIVLACDWGAEERHHGIADELLHCPAPALELVAQPLVVRPQDGLNVLRVEPLSA